MTSPARVTHVEPGIATIQTNDGVHTVRVSIERRIAKVGDLACVIEDDEGYHEATIRGRNCSTLSIRHN